MRPQKNQIETPITHSIRIANNKWQELMEWCIGNPFSCVAAIFVFWLIWFLPGETPYFDRLIDLVKILLTIVGGFIASLGAYIAWKRVQVMQEGHLTDRFTRAIDQLGSGFSDSKGRFIPNREIRIGAVYALGQIAVESSKYRIPVLEVLAAYVKKNELWDELAQREHDDKTERVDDYDQAVDMGLFRYDHVIYAIIKAIGDIGKVAGPVHVVDLSKSRLGGFGDAFNGGVYRNVDFSGSTLSGAQLTYTVFVFCTFKKTTMINADCSKAKFELCQFAETNLVSANLSEARGVEDFHLKNIRFSKETIFPEPLRDLAEKMITEGKNRGYGPEE